MHSLKLSTLLVVLALFTQQMLGQTPLQVAYQNITKGSTLPEDILASRTAVFMNVPLVSPDTPRHWQKLASQLHATLVSLKIDAVAYYQWQDLNSGVDATRSFFETLANRDISQVIVLSLHNNEFQLTIIPTVQGTGFLDSKAQTWHTSGPDLSSILENLTAVIRSTGPQLGNFLVVESPEVFTDTGIFTNNRFETFQADLKLDKLAVPLNDKDDVENPQLPANQQLLTVFQQYPFNYELVDYQKGEDLLRRAGFQYVLLYLYASEPSVRRLLDYNESTTGESRMVYKFYMRHIISGDIYLGDQWDASGNKEEALRNHINHLKRFLKVE